MSARTAVPAVLLVANLLLFASWGVLRDTELAGNRRDSFLEAMYSPEGSFTRVFKTAVFRNDGYMQPFFDLVKAEQRVLFVGTSESIHNHNIAHQLNVLTTESPKFEMMAQAGMSPIGRCLAFGKMERDHLRPPPLVLIVNLVYFTNSHDVIDDGWLTRVVPSDLFLEMNHGNVLDHVTEDVRRRYAEHFAHRRWIAPISVQKYLGALLFLRCNRPDPVAPGPSSMREQVYDYVAGGKKPEYDEARGVKRGYRASDRFNKQRWEVKEAEDCLNLAGVISTVKSLGSLGTPALFIVMPTNRDYYAFNGLDMERYDARYRVLRDAIGEAVSGEAGQISLLDLYEQPELDFGFGDRMHLDAYGDYQLAKHILQTPEFQAFRLAARRYYEGSVNEAP